jgi:outer membrane protein assembly factor BamA
MRLSLPRLAVALAVLVAVRSEALSQEGPPPAGEEPDLSIPSEAESEAALPTGEELEAAGARIGKIRIHRLNIFDPDDPKEDFVLYRLANRLHVISRDRVIRRELLFQEGDLYRQDLIDESERNLRAIKVIYHVKIRTTAYHDGLVDLEVVTQDTWTLRPSVKVSRAGGNTTSSLGFNESNLLGHFKLLQFSHRKEIDRSTTGFFYSDPRLFGSRFNLSSSYQHHSDGKSRALSIARPFFSLDSRWSMSASGEHVEQHARLFENGDDISEFREFREAVSFSYAFSGGLIDSRVKRYGLGAGYLRSKFSQEPGDKGFGIVPLPEDQKFVGPFFTVERLKSRFIKVVNYNHFEREEDFNLGNDLNFSLQFSLRAFGADRSEGIISLTDSFGVPVSDSTNLLFSFSASGRTGGGDASNVILSESIESYWRATRHQTFYTRTAYDVGINLDRQNQFLLGGDNGLRGYPSRQFAGDRRFLITLEHRYFGDWEIFRLIRIGFAAFADAGDAWYDSPDLHSDFGLGLRFAVSRSSVASVSRLDLAYSVDAKETDSPRLQLLFGTALKF